MAAAHSLTLVRTRTGAVCLQRQLRPAGSHASHPSLQYRTFLRKEATKKPKAVMARETSRRRRKESPKALCVNCAQSRQVARGLGAALAVAAGSYSMSVRRLASIARYLDGPLQLLAASQAVIDGVKKRMQSSMGKAVCRVLCAVDCGLAPGPHQLETEGAAKAHQQAGLHHSQQALEQRPAGPEGGLPAGRYRKCRRDHVERYVPPGA